MQEILIKQVGIRVFFFYLRQISNFIPPASPLQKLSNVLVDWGKKRYKSVTKDYEHFDELYIDNIKIDILVNNAGTNIPEPFLNVKKSSMETLLSVNTKAVFNVAQLCANQIIKLKRKQGSIINISSVQGLQSQKLVPPYV